MATKRDLMEMAYRRCGVVAEDEPMTADQAATAEAIADSAFAGLQAEAPVVWTLDAIPTIALLPLVMVLAYDLAIHNSEAPKETRGRAVIRYLSVVRPDDREDARDLDDDGTISDEEADAGARAAYY
jgi:hypothetical protein